MRNTIIKGLVLGLTVNGLTFAADPNTNIDSVSPSGSGITTPSATTGTSKTSGTVESIDRGGNRIRVRDGQGRVTEHQLSNDTIFSSNGKKGKFSDLNAGDFVIVESNPDVGVLRVDFGTASQ